MGRQVPYAENFEWAKRLSKIQKIIFYMSLLSSIIITIFSTTFAKVTKFGTIVSIVSLVILFALDYFVKEYQNTGETLRKKDFWDNSFGTKLNDNSTELYYTNDKINFGLQKCIYNTCENILHSINTAKIMKKKSLWKLFLLGGVLLFFAIKGFYNNAIGIIVLQLFLSKYIVLDFLDLRAYIKYLEEIRDQMKSLLSSEIKPDTLDYQVKAIYSLLAYECNISHFNVLLDSKIFIENNEKISKEWDEFKKRYPVKVGLKNDSE